MGPLVDLVDGTVGGVDASSITSISGTYADLNEVVAASVDDLTTNAAYSVEITDVVAEAAADKLVALIEDTTGAKNFATVDAIAGSVDNLLAIVRDGDTTLKVGVAFEATDAGTTAEISELKAATTGIVTAIVSDGDIATLLDPTTGLEARLAHRRTMSLQLLCRI